MEILLNILRFMHVLGFVFMSVPLFNLIVVNERGKFGPTIIYHVDRFMENVIKGGAPRCFTFQMTVLISGVLLLVFGDLGIESLFTNWVLIVKTLLLFTLMGLLSYVHFGLQPKIKALLAQVKPEQPVPDEINSQIKPFRTRRKKLASICLFLVITIIILGLQVYSTFNPILTILLIVLAALFSRRVYTSLIPYGWV